MSDSLLRLEIHSDFIYADYYGYESGWFFKKGIGDLVENPQELPSKISSILNEYSDSYCRPLKDSDIPLYVGLIHRNVIRTSIEKHNLEIKKSQKKTYESSG